jgi:hypothetical protein
MATTRGERLRIAREKLFKSARLAAKAMGIPVSTYGAHERAESSGGRDYGPDEAKKYGRRFRVTPEWLLTGREAFRPGEVEEQAPPKVPVVGYVGASAEVRLYEVAQRDLDQVDCPGSTEATVAVEIRGDGLGPFFNRWLLFYDNLRRPPAPDHIGELCVVGLRSGRILVTQVQLGSAEGRFNLLSATDKPTLDVAIEWAAAIDSVSRRGRR